MLCGALVGETAAQQRGALSITPKVSEAAGAADAQRIQLYGGSKALVIGINTYEAGWPRLTNAIPDAEAVAQALEARGYAVTLKRDLKSDELDRSLKDFFVNDGADEQTGLLLWFAGHGHTTNGEGYLVPADAPGAQTDRGFRSKAISLRRFGEYMREAKSKHVLAIFDSCFAGTVFDVARSTPPAAITNATAQPVRQFISSGDANQEVSDNGLFRRLFLDALAGLEPKADANGDGFITGTELGLFLGDKITNLTQTKQTPRYGKLNALGLDRGDYVFGLDARQVAAAAPAAAQADPARSAYLDYVKGFEQGQALFRGKPFTPEEMGPLASSVLERGMQQLKGTRWQGGATWGGVAFDATGRQAQYAIGLGGEPGRLTLQGVLGDGGRRAGTTRAVTAPTELILLGEWQEGTNNGGAILRVGADEIKLLWGPRFLREAIWTRETTAAAAEQAPATPAEPKVAMTAPPAKPATASAQPSAPSATSATARSAPGTVFRDCPVCPDMVVIPAGEFMMGSEAEKDEQPVRKVTIARPFAVGQFEVTEENWEACLQDGGCGDYEPWGTGKKHRGKQPAASVSFNDAKVYMAWLTKKTGKTYRLLSEAEWEYAARAGTTTRYPWARDAGAGQANCNDCGTTFSNRIAPAGAFPANPFGLHDMHGNVWEWVEDCYVNTYARHPAPDVYGPAPSDGAARIEDGVCKFGGGSRVSRGGSYAEQSIKIRSSARYAWDPRVRNITLGFRVARALD